MGEINHRTTACINWAKLNLHCLFWQNMFLLASNKLKSKMSSLDGIDVDGAQIILTSKIGKMQSKSNWRTKANGKPYTHKTHKITRAVSSIDRKPIPRAKKINKRYIFVLRVSLPLHDTSSWLHLLLVLGAYCLLCWTVLFSSCRCCVSAFSFLFFFSSFIIILCRAYLLKCRMLHRITVRIFIFIYEPSIVKSAHIFVHSSDCK